MKKVIKSILSFLLFAGIYFMPLCILIFLIGFFLLIDSNAPVESTQAGGWLIIIVSYFISGIISIIISILTVKKTVLRKIKEDGTKDKIPKYILFFIIIASLINVALFGFWIYGAINSRVIYTYEDEEPVTNPTIYNIDAINEMIIFENEKYISNSFMADIKDNYENNYIVNFNNISFQNNTYKFSYQIKNNKKIILINDKEIMTKNFKDENLVGISIYTNYLKASEMIDKEHTIHKSIILDNNQNIVYEYYEFTDINNPYNAFEIIDDSNKNNIGYKMYKLTLNNDIFEINNLVKSTFSCNDFQINNDFLTEEDEIKYYICNK